MFAVIELVLPLFGLIFLGFAAGKIMRIPYEGLAWMNFFIVYVALPAMFYRLLSVTPIEQFANVGFIAISVFATLLVFAGIFVLAGLINGGNVAEATIQGFAAAYGNIGYMGPPLALAALGPVAGVPVALIFCFENAMHFTLAPLLMSLHGGERRPAGQLAREIAVKIFTHPFIVATIVGVLAAVFKVELPSSVNSLLEFLSGAAAPCALFVMGVTAALRPLKRVPVELGYIVPVKLVIHPLLVFVLMETLLPGFDRTWVFAAVLLAALPTATNVFVIAQQYQVWQERASSAVVVSTIAATATVTGLLYFMLNVPA
ncbi:AEC family transporter [Salaquimonas pukyongi]|uniref:AEC family transporter n=1 Tax=Salaquimonas pukyongi TaxID=2712698 RepID=UPI00096B8CC2|nr:AEC family transporter [Salaquimonas pukyongi]